MFRVRTLTTPAANRAITLAIGVLAAVAVGAVPAVGRGGDDSTAQAAEGAAGSITSRGAVAPRARGMQRVRPCSPDGREPYGAPPADDGGTLPTPALPPDDSTSPDSDTPTL